MSLGWEEDILTPVVVLLSLAVTFLLAWLVLESKGVAPWQKKKDEIKSHGLRAEIKVLGDDRVGTFLVRKAQYITKNEIRLEGSSPDGRPKIQDYFEDELKSSILHVIEAKLTGSPVEVQYVGNHRNGSRGESGAARAIDEKNRAESDARKSEAEVYHKTKDLIETINKFARRDGNRKPE